MSESPYFGTDDEVGAWLAGTGQTPNPNSVSDDLALPLLLQEARFVLEREALDSEPSQVARFAAALVSLSDSLEAERRARDEAERALGIAKESEAAGRNAWLAEKERADRAEADLANALIREGLAAAEAQRLRDALTELAGSGCRIGRPENTNCRIEYPGAKRFGPLGDEDLWCFACVAAASLEGPEPEQEEAR